MERNENFEEIDASKEWEYVLGDKTKLEANYVCLMEEKCFEGADDYIFNQTVCGRSLAEWVGKACPEKPIFLTLSEQENFLDLIRPYTKNNEYTVVLFANTPLVTRGAVQDMLAFASRKRLNVCRLKAGYILKNDYIANIDEIFSKIVYKIDSNDFFEVNSPDDLLFVKEILTKRVFNFHKNNGVTFENERLTNLDANVFIGEKTQIAGGVSLLSGSYIGKNVTIQEGCVISNSKIDDDCIIETGAIIKGSIVKQGSLIETASLVNHSVIGEKTRVSLSSKLSNSATKDGVVIGENSYLDGVNVLKNAKIGKNCVLVGDGVPVVIAEGACLDICTEIVKKKKQEDNLAEVTK